MACWRRATQSAGITTWVEWQGLHSTPVQARFRAGGRPAAAALRRCHAASTSARGISSMSIGRSPVAAMAMNSGDRGDDLSQGDGARPATEDLQPRAAQHISRQGDHRADHPSDLHQPDPWRGVSQAAPADGRDGRLGGLAPQVVDDDVYSVLPGRLGQGRRVVGAAKRHGGRRVKPSQDGLVTAGGDHPAGSSEWPVPQRYGPTRQWRLAPARFHRAEARPAGSAPARRHSPG